MRRKLYNNWTKINHDSRRIKIFHAYLVVWVEFFDFAETFFMESPLPPESKMVHIIEISCAQNCRKALENWAKISLFVALGGGILKNTQAKQFETKNYWRWAKWVFTEFTEKRRNVKKLIFLAKKSIASWQFCTQPISIICFILNSGSKGL